MSEQATMITAVIDGREVRVSPGTTILKAAESIGIKIPVFCYHPRLAISGSCRMCLVEVEKIPKPVTSCSTELAEGMVVRTDTPGVLKARAAIMEFLLINHPLDCPVCDKGGECMLQDNSYDWGWGKVRFTEERRQFVKPVPLSDRILLDRERCILCTRCVRFCQEVSDHRQLAVTERGHVSIIETAPGRTFDSQFSGNTVEICPVGALTSRQFRFKARPWEMAVTPSVCPFCGCGCNIYINARSGKIMRFMSRENPEIDEGWLCDRGRYGYERINSIERLKMPLVRKNGRLIEASWDEAISAAVTGLKNIRVKYGAQAIGGIGSVWGTNQENEVFYVLLKDSLGSQNIDITLSGDGRPVAAAIAEGLGDFKITDIDGADAILLLGADPSANQPIIDLRLKKAVKTRGTPVITLHENDVEMARYSKSFLKYRHGEEESLLRVLLSSIKREKGSELLDADFKKTGLSRGEVDNAMSQCIAGRNSLVLVDASLAQNDVRVYLLKELRSALGPGAAMGLLFDSANGFGALRNIFSRPRATERELCGKDMAAAAEKGEIKALYLLNADKTDAAALSMARKGAEFIVCHSMFMNDAAAYADIVFPAAAFSEKNGTFTNTAGMEQEIVKALNPPAGAISEADVVKEIRKSL